MNVDSAGARRVREREDHEHTEGATRAERNPQSLYRCEDASDPYPTPRLCPPSRDAKTTLFARQRDDTDAISPDDVAQWQIGDCYLHAALMALASSPEGRARIRNMITENRDAHGNVLSYSVRFYINGREMKPLPIAVDALMPAGGLARARGTADGASEIWPLVIEKAYAQLYLQYASIHGAWPSNALAKLTGLRSREIEPQKDDALETVQRAWADGKPMLFSTVAKPGQPLVGPHCYVLVGIEKDANGNAVAVLKNPWGREYPTVSVPFAQWKKVFTTITTM
jgi:hypothetical protein